MGKAIIPFFSDITGSHKTMEKSGYPDVDK
jgi:hypothetical protein